ncbi:MAG: ParB/Srx family N-terminal domain-containing protein, partial [Alphaproteobacteria bacterium]
MSSSSPHLTIVYRTLGALTPDPRNARTHPRRQVDQIAAAIRAFGFTNPILIDPDDDIIAGHGRLLAAKAVGMSEVPTITLPDLTEAQKRALRLADNKIALGAGWDLDLLKVELADLASLDLSFDLTLTGFSTGEIDVLLNGGDNGDDDPLPTDAAPARAKPGDIWSLGDHRIGCGDARDPTFLQAVIGDGARADAAFLDPPYNVRINGHANARGRHREFAMASGEMTDAAFCSFLADTLGAAAAVSRDGAVHFVCMDWRHMDQLSDVGKQIYGGLLNLCVWNKSNAGMGSLY